MPDVDFSKYKTINDLREQIKKIEAEIERRCEQKREEFYEQAKQVAAELGIPVKDLFGKPRKKTTNSKKSKRNKTPQTTEARVQPQGKRSPQSHEPPREDQERHDAAGKAEAAAG
jgi:hypothetical protein